MPSLGAGGPLSRPPPLPRQSHAPVASRFPPPISATKVLQWASSVHSGQNGLDDLRLWRRGFFYAQWWVWAFVDQSS